MASKTIRGGLIVAAVLVLFFGFLFLDVVIESEADSRASCAAADEGVEAGNETCDKKDLKFIGFQTFAYILLVFFVAGLLVWAAFR